MVKMQCGSVCCTTKVTNPGPGWAWETRPGVGMGNKARGGHGKRGPGWAWETRPGVGMGNKARGGHGKQGPGRHSFTEDMVRRWHATARPLFP